MSDMIELGRDETAFSAYRSEPSGPFKGALIVVHEIWGLVDHIKEVADRFAAEGYLVLAPALISAQTLVETEGAPGSAAQSAAAVEDAVADLQRTIFNPDPEVRNAAQPRLRDLFAPVRSPELSDQALASLHDCVDYLADQPDVDGRIGIIGFCFGGIQAFSLAVDEPRLKAAVPFYGKANFTAEELRDIRCPILAFYGEKDRNLMDHLPDFTRTMDEASVDFRPTAFAGTGHAFFNDTNPYAYNSDAAEQAWRMTLEFLNETVSG